MPRPKCRRLITQTPSVTYFKPQGVPLVNLEAVALTLDEFEAVRLADYDGLYQEQAAERMGISRQTFGRIIEAAHKKIAEALLHGKALAIEGGHVELADQRKISCGQCGHTWDVAYGTGRPQACPQCQGALVHRSDDDRGFGGRTGGGRRRGMGRGRCRAGER